MYGVHRTSHYLQVLSTDPFKKKCVFVLAWLLFRQLSNVFSNVLEHFFVSLLSTTLLKESKNNYQRFKMTSKFAKVCIQHNCL